MHNKYIRTQPTCVCTCSPISHLKYANMITSIQPLQQPFEAKFKTLHIDKVDLARLRVSMFSSAHSCGLY